MGSNLLTNILVLPDSHCKPGVSNERFTWLGRLIAERKPDVIVDIGDFSDMPSLSDYDVGKFSYEGRRYNQDIEAGHDGFARMESEIAKENKFKRILRKAQYNPQRIKLFGNHEERILRILQRDPKLIGTIGLEDFNIAQWGWKSPKYLVPVEVNGVFFNHYFVSGIKGKAISGENPATMLCNKMHASCIAGHNHLLDYSERTDVIGRKFQCMTVGCFLAEGQVEEYSGQAQKMWHNGVVYLHDVKDGQYDFETISLERLKKSYA